MKDITDWSVINKLDNEFVKQFIFAYVFNNGKSAIIITNDDCVYVCGNNSRRCLGLHYHINTLDMPEKLEELCNKRVIDIIDCDSLKCALTSDGKLYFGVLAIV